MGVYSINRETYTNVLEGIEAEEMMCEDFFEAGLNACYESECNLHNILKNIGIAELAVFESTGQEIVYEAGSISGIIEKLKAAASKLWAKIKGIFDKFMAKFKSYGKDDKGFVEKYRAQILAGSTAGLKVKGFTFTTDAVTAGGAWNALKGCEPVKKAEAVLSMSRSNKPDEKHFKDSEEYKDKMRGCILGGGDLTAQEFNKELYAKLRNGEEKAEEIEVTDALRSSYVSFLSSGTDKTLTTMEDDYKNQEKSIKQLIEKLDGVKKKANENIDKAKEDEIQNASSVTANVVTANGIYTDCINMCQLVSSARMKAFNQKRAQAKSVCVKCMNRKKPKNESTEYNNESTEYNSILDGIELI